MARVYVSSTIADLRQERQAVMEWLVAAGHQPVHSYRPDSDTVRDSCLEDVDACDLYVLILGHRYGLQIQRDNPDDLSITHLEFRRAGRSGIPRIALLRTSIPDVSLSDLADPRRLALVSAFRAEVAHEVRPAEFGDLQGLVHGLSTGVQVELGKLGNRLPSDRATGRGAATLALRLAPRPVFLADREGLLTELDARLTRGQRPQVAVLCGLGGAGKTSVAIEYAHRHLAEVAVCWQFPAEDPAVLTAEFGALAAQLGAREVVDPRDPVASVHGVLAQIQAGWLLVFDNAPDRVSILRFVPPAGSGRVLITTQNQHWPPGQTLNVPVLDLEAAAGFLVNRTDDPDLPTARELAEQLGGLPLALEQAAAYMQATGDSFTDYLASFRRRRADILARGEPADYGKTVATTFALAFDRLRQASPSAVGLLRLLAFFAPEAIPLQRLSQPRPELLQLLSPGVKALLLPLLMDPLAAKDAIAALRAHSLISRPEGGSASMHRLVRAVAIDQMDSSVAAEWRHAASILISGDLIATIRPLAQELRKLTPKLQELARRIRISATPEKDVEEALRVTVELSSLIARHAMPNREIIAQWASAFSSPSAVNKELDNLRKLNDNALFALDAYVELSRHEQHRRGGDQGSIHQYAEARIALIRVRRQAFTEVLELTDAFEHFIRTLS